MSAYRLVASDLDGTLLKNDQTLSEENRQAIQALTDKGIQFAISTGRAYTEAPEAVRRVPQIRWFITSDGASIYDAREDKRYTACMDKALSKIVLDALFACDTALTVRYNGASHVDARFTREDYMRCRMTEYYYYGVTLTNVPTENFREACYAQDELEMICVFFRTDEDLERCKQLFEETGLLETASSSPNSLEIYSVKAGKGNALVRLAELLGIPREATIAMGDTTNDSSIIAAAGLGLAMANACDELKAIADDVICSNEDHAAKYILEHYAK